MTIGFLGPRGTFSEMAALRYNANAHTKPYQTIYDVIMSCHNREVDVAVVPIENSTEGPVNITLDTLIYDCDVSIIAELNVSAEHFLLCSKENSEPVTKIYSHPQALAQCRGFLRDNYDGCEEVATNSTAEAAHIVSNETGAAAISNRLCAELYDLKVIKGNIEDNKNNVTKFVAITAASNLTTTAKTSNGSKATLAFSTQNKPGELYKILGIFSLWDLNMSKIVSRPKKNGTGGYVFLIDIDITSDDKDLADALVMVRRKTELFKPLGIYSVMEKR